ncbi:MAG: hypothetical protein ACK4L8_10820 [Nitrincola lacisaponensis]|uniref:hypothetical protein n=1 Tax=Nitrincola lacisaponensis TaxID=267850 RepID=UPI00391C9D5E
MTISVRVTEQELNEVLEWAQEHGEQMTTDHEEGTYEEGVSDALRWALGYIAGRPDQ